jgi:hypothetical protein
LNLETFCVSISSELHEDYGFKDSCCKISAAWSNKHYFEKVREAANFFKHVDRDLQSGKTSIEFNTEENVFCLFEASRSLRIIEGSNYVFHPEFRAFVCWLGLKYSELVWGRCNKKLVRREGCEPRQLQVLS